MVSFNEINNWNISCCNIRINKFNLLDLGCYNITINKFNSLDLSCFNIFNVFEVFSNLGCFNTSTIYLDILIICIIIIVLIVTSLILFIDHPDNIRAFGDNRGRHPEMPNISVWVRNPGPKYPTLEADRELNKVRAYKVEVYDKWIINVWFKHKL